MNKEGKPPKRKEKYKIYMNMYASIRHDIEEEINYELSSRSLHFFYILQTLI